MLSSAPTAPTSLYSEQCDGESDPRAARVNNVMMADAQQSSEIVIGRVLVSLVPTTVLFDSEASHSFISQSFGSANDLQSELLPSPLAVHTPGSRCNSSVFVPNAEI